MSSPNPVPTPTSPAALPGPKVLLMGDSGTGKTHALQTLLPTGVTPFVFFLEQGMETIAPIFDGQKAHYKFIKSHNANWTQLMNVAKAINQMSFESLTKMQDAQKTRYAGFLEVVTACNNFICDCCKKSWGDIAKWNTDRAVVIDGLSGLSDMAMQLVVGMKPVRNQADWGVAQNTIRMLLDPLVSDLHCSFILISHTERERDEITGGSVITIKTLGNKLAPDIPKKFSDVIMAERVGTTFTWSTAAGNAVTKTRNLEIKAGLPPSFAPLIEGWKRKGGKIEETK